MVCWAIVAVGVLLALSVTMPWAEITGSASGTVPMNVSVSGLGSADATVDTGGGPSADRFVATSAEEAFEDAGGSPGGFAIVAGILAALAGLAYEGTRHRRAAVIVATVAGLIGVIGALQAMTSASGRYADVNLAVVVAPGVGVITALVLSILLVALAITAMVFEHQVTVALTQTGRGVPTSGFHFTPAPSTSTPQERVDGEPAPVGLRFRAFVIDIVVVTFLYGVVILLPVAVITSIDTDSGVLDVVGPILLVLGSVLPFAYFALREGREGRTPGQRSHSLAVVGPTGHIPAAAQAYRRNLTALIVPAFALSVAIYEIAETVGALLGIAVLFVALKAIVTVWRSIQAYPQHQGVHDHFADGTMMINHPRTTAIPRDPDSAPPTAVPWIAGWLVVLAVTVVIAVLPDPTPVSSTGALVTTTRMADRLTTANTPARTVTPTPPAQLTTVAPAAGGDPFSYPRLSPGACASPGYPGGSTCSFSSPSGNFLCFVTPDGANCAAPAGEPLVNGVQVPLAGSINGATVDANIISVDTSGATSIGAVTAGVNKLTRESASSALPYNHRMTAHGFTCAVDTTAVTCRHDASGHGFAVSRQRHEFF